MIEQLTREQVLDLKPCRKSNWLIHMVIMGNKAWRYRDRVGDRWYTRIKFAPEKPTWPDEYYEEVSYEELSERNVLVADVPDYFGSISAAWEVIKKMQSEWSWDMEMINAANEVDVRIGRGRATSVNVPEAVCKAALLVVMGL